MAPHRILISRLSAVGDCIHTLPVLCALRDRFPDAEIGWVVQSGGASLLRGHAALNHLIEVPRGWLTSPEEVRSVRRRLRSLKFDVALDVQSLTKSAVAAWLSGARQRIAFARPQGRELAPWMATRRIRPQTDHVVDRYLELLRPLGIERPNVRFQVPETPTDRAETDRFLDQAHLNCPFLAINPGAGWDSKLWPAKRFASLARSVGQQLNVPSVVVWAGDRERQWAEQIVAGSGGHALMAPATTLPQLAALLRSAQVVVGADTGPLHLAAAVGTQCVGLYGPTRPAKSGPYGDGHVAIQQYYQGGSSRERRGRDNHAMRAIEVEPVAEACCRLFREQADRASQAA